MYTNIVSALCESAAASRILGKRRKKKQIVGWNRHVSQAHTDARIKFQTWILHGRPPQGVIFNQMCESRKIFKSRLRWCQNHQDQIKMDILATHQTNHDFRAFWKCAEKLNSKPGLPVSVGVGK